MAERCIEILAIPEGKECLILDIGCGSGLSGSVLTDHGYEWIGVDISPSMLEVAKANEVEGDLINLDIGQGFSFRPGSFDYAISVSAIQWLCIAEKSSHNVNRRLKNFFVSLYKCLTIGSRCAFQFYPANPEQINLITKAALENGFTGEHPAERLAHAPAAGLHFHVGRHPAHRSGFADHRLVVGNVADYDRKWFPFDLIAHVYGSPFA